jgi:hypothetical protein
MSTKERIEFFRNALEICARHGRSPEAAITVRGQAHTLRQLLKTLGGDVRLPRITEAEARALARESTNFSYREILTGLSGCRRAAARGARIRSRSRRAVAVEREASL